MKKRVKILAFAFLLLGSTYLTTQLAKAEDPGDVTCWNVYTPTIWPLGKKIWRCTPSGCEDVRASSYEHFGYCAPI
jgi:hypothetical protein